MSAPILLAATTFAFRGATLIDGTGAPPLSNALLVVSEGRIVSVGPATPEALARLPPGTQVLTGDGKWILPGLIDAHVHAESEQDLKTMLNWGVTSVRLMSEDVADGEVLAKGSRTRNDIPEVFPASPIFTTKAGWWDQGQPADRNLNRFPSTPGQARDSVRKARALGAREIKVMLDDMAWCRAPKPPLPKLPPEVLGALIGEARKLEMSVIVHAPNRADAQAAIADGATALAHGVLDPLDDATIAVMKMRGVFYVPTMDIFEFLADTRAFLDGVLAQPGVSGALTASTALRLRSAEYSDGYRERYPNFESLGRRLPALRENLRALRAAGVPIALGTDMWAIPGLAVSVEMDLYADAGLPPLEVIRSATQTAARSLGIDADRGTLEAGKRADFVILPASPIRRPGEAIRHVTDTYKAGVRVGPVSPERGP